MDDTVKQIVYVVITAMLSYFGTNKVNELDADKVVETYASIIQQQAHMLGECK